MGDLEPRFVAKIEFPYKEVLTPSSHLAQWISNLGRGLNDLLLANRRLDEGFKNGAGGHQVIYDIRAVAAHAWELAKFLKETNSEQVDAFRQRFQNSISAAQTDYESILGILQEPETPLQERSFKALLASARDQASHYAEIDHKLLRQALVVHPID